MIYDELQVDSTQEDDDTDCDMKLKTHVIDRIASQVDEKKLIRREVVLRLYKIFDPLDFLTPRMIKSKMLLQKWTKADLEWGEP